MLYNNKFMISRCRKLFLAVIAGELYWEGAPALVSVVKGRSVIPQRFNIINEFYCNQTAAFARNIMTLVTSYDINTRHVM